MSLGQMGLRRDITALRTEIQIHPDAEEKGRVEKLSGMRARLAFLEDTVCSIACVEVSFASPVPYPF